VRELHMTSGHNPKLKVEYFEATSAVWTAPVTVDLTYGDLRWQRKNASVYPLTGSYSGKPQPLIREGEFDGAQVVLATGKTRTIRRTKGGKWQAATTSKPTLYIAGTDGTEGNSGTTGRIVARDVVLLISTRSSLYSAVRITVPSPATDASQYAPAEGYWRAGSVLVGSVYLFGDDTDWGRKVETTSRREVISYDDGTSVSRILGPPARIVTVAWTDGVDTSAGSEDTDDPAYHTLDTGGQPLALSDSTPWDAQGIYTRLSTLAHDQLIYLPRIVPFDSTPTPQVINRRHNLVYGRIENDSLNLDTVQGEEGVDEVIRVGVVTIGELT
jgi:hypothetical protein